MSFSMVVIALDLGHILPFLLGNNIDIHGRGVGVTTLSPSSAALETVLFRFGGGSLLSER